MQTQLSALYGLAWVALVTPASHPAASGTYPLNLLPGSSAQESPPWKAPSRAARKKNPLADSADAFAAGQAIYAQQCVSCHGETGMGDGRAAKDLERAPGNFTLDQVQKQSDGALFWKITTGRAPMTAFKDTLDAKARWQVVRYLRGFGDVGAPLVTPKFEATDSMRAAASTLFEAYDDCRIALGKGDDHAAAGSVKKLIDSVEGLQALSDKTIPKASAAAWASAVNTTAKNVGALGSAKDLAGRRLAFAELSTSSAALWSQFGHGYKDALRVFEGKAGAWIQGGPKPVNPYTGGPFKDAPVRRIAGKRPKKGNSAIEGQSQTNPRIGDQDR